MSKRVKREGQNFMDWLDELVEANPEAQKAFEDEMLRLRLADALRDVREAAGMTQALVAEEMDVRQSFVSKLERPDHNHTIETVLSYLQAVGAGLVLAIVEANGRDLIPASALAEDVVLLPKEVKEKAEAAGMSPREYVLSCFAHKQTAQEMKETFSGELRQHMTEFTGWETFEQAKPSSATLKSDVKPFARQAKENDFAQAA